MPVCCGDLWCVWGSSARKFTQLLVERAALTKEISAAQAAREITDRLNACVLLGVVRQVERGFVPGSEQVPGHRDLLLFYPPPPPPPLRAGVAWWLWWCRRIALIESVDEVESVPFVHSAFRRVLDVLDAR